MIPFIVIQNGSVNVMYSTPSIYVNYFNKDKDFTLSTKSDDFFPYASAPWSYWTVMMCTYHTCILLQCHLIIRLFHQ